MSFGVKQKDCRFYVNEAERTVVCVIPNTRDMLLQFILDNFNFPDLDLAYIVYARLLSKLELPSTFIGKAVCSADDEWDEETGRMIAFSRAKNKLYTSFFKRANTYVQAIDRRLGDIITCFNDMGMVLENKKNALDHEIAVRTGTEE